MTHHPAHQPIAEVARLVRLTDPVLIAPRGRDYHDPQVLWQSWTGAKAWVANPRCGAHADRWLAVDVDFAQLLDRGPCVSCALFRNGQTTISDTEDAGPPAPPVLGVTKETP